MLEIFLRSRGGLTSYNKNIRVNFAGKKKENETLRGVYVFRIREKKFKPNLVFVLALI